MMIKREFQTDFGTVFMSGIEESCDIRLDTGQRIREKSSISVYFKDEQFHMDIDEPIEYIMHKTKEAINRCVHSKMMPPSLEYRSYKNQIDLDLYRFYRAYKELTKLWLYDNNDRYWFSGNQPNYYI